MILKALYVSPQAGCSPSDIQEKSQKLGSTRKAQKRGSPKFSPQVNPYYRNTLQNYVPQNINIPYPRNPSKPGEESGGSDFQSDFQSYYITQIFSVNTHGGGGEVNK